jgi:hypothetical protein
MPQPNLRIPWFVWWSLIRELKHRSGGRRESGAFLLGRSGTRQVTHFICYDDLDQTAFDTGIIVFHGEGFVRCGSFAVRAKSACLLTCTPMRPSGLGRVTRIAPTR